MSNSKLEPQINPKWCKHSMTLQQAANQADARGMSLRLSWSPWGGCRVVAVPKDTAWESEGVRNV